MEKWLGSKNCMLLLQRTGGWLLNPCKAAHNSLKMKFWNSDALSTALTFIHLHTCIHIIKNISTRIKNVLEHQDCGIEDKPVKSNNFLFFTSKTKFPFPLLFLISPTSHFHIFVSLVFNVEPSLQPNLQFLDIIIPIRFVMSSSIK